MGIYATNYVVFGFTLNKKELKKLSIKYMSEEFMPYIEGSTDTGYELIYDQVCDEYIVFGKVLNSEGQDDKHNIKAIPLKEISNLDWEESYKITQKFIECIGQETYDQLQQKEPRLLIFTHYA
jgi:hypothetical protein